MDAGSRIGEKEALTKRKQHESWIELDDSSELRTFGTGAGLREEAHAVQTRLGDGCMMGISITSRMVHHFIGYPCNCLSAR